MSNSRFAVATHVLTSLALVAEDDPAARLTSEALAASINTSPVVIRRIIGRLRAAGLVVAQTGRGGGAALARPASKISLLDVHRAVDEPVLFALNPNQPNPQCDGELPHERRARAGVRRRRARRPGPARPGPAVVAGRRAARAAGVTPEDQS
jgi:DNA-binding IscR family transcriptional regulator